MPQKKLGAIDQRPGKIDPHVAPFRRSGLGIFLHGLYVGIRGKPRKDRQVESLGDLASVLPPEESIAASFGPLCSLLWIVAEFSMCSHWVEASSLTRSLSIPVARAERPNNVRKELVMLPSASATADMSLGIYEKGSGTALVYRSELPVMSFSASINTSASTRRNG